MRSERVAQSVEHRPFKALVLGSNPSPLTKFPLKTNTYTDPRSLGGAWWSVLSTSFAGIRNILLGGNKALLQDAKVCF